MYELVKGTTYKINIDEEGKITHDKPLEFVYNRFLLAQFPDGKFGPVIRHDNQLTLYFEKTYDYLDFYAEGLLEIKENSKYGVMDFQENIMVSPEYKKGIKCDIDNKLFIVKEKTLFGVVDDKGNIIVPFEYKKIEFFSKKNRLKYFIINNTLSNVSQGINRHKIDGIPERSPSMVIKSELVGSMLAYFNNYYRPVYEGKGIYLILINDKNQQALFNVHNKMIVENYWLNDSINHYFPESNIVELKYNSNTIGESCKIFNLNTKEYLLPNEVTNYVEEIDKFHLLISINKKIGVYSLIKFDWIIEPKYNDAQVEGNKVTLISSKDKRTISI